ncbi:MAG: ATP-dependent helicase [Taibaiella sp.]|nr:ATP-dependent helicase [Taibaiella sp.]
MAINEELYLERYNKLNDRQQDAVDTIYGPVMVIAGPGTGKTEVLSMRIANLMRSEAQVQPHEILCLTYTDEATNSMRRRLVQVIGAAAHKVNIHTFHSFCNNIIQGNSEHFSARSLQPITDLERTDLLYRMLEELPQGHQLRKLSGNIYFDASKLTRLFDHMKREYLTAEGISAAIDEYIAGLPEREEYIYKKSGKNFKKGDLKQTQIDEEVKKMELTRAAALLFTTYDGLMKETGRYDFNDMILWVLQALKDYPWMLQSYQERYQFILVDEYQDTNGAQNELINVLTSFWEDPNIFVVGDDDQSIYEFQGARIRNIVDFYTRYKETIKIVVLPHNYRSSQQIIDKAMATIQFNKQRLINQLEELALDKNIIAAADRFKDVKEPVHPVVKMYNSVLQEEADIVMQIEQLQRDGVALKDVAVLYAQHKQANNIIALLERKQIPYNVKKAVNILDLPIIEQTLNVLRYLVKERQKTFSGEELLFELMHTPYFGINATEIARLALFMQGYKDPEVPRRWRLLLSNNQLLDTLGLEPQSLEAIKRLSRNLDNWEREQLIMPVPLLVEKIVYEGGIIAHLLQETDHVWYMQVMYSFFEFVKDIHDRIPKIKAAQLLQMVERMNDEKIPVAAQRVIQNDNGVRFYTAHSAKGNEFEYVFLIGCTKNYWEDKRGMSNVYKMPDTVTATPQDAQDSNKTEVARRLFYVALTRAKKHLYVSYSLNDNAGKSLEASVFIDEISLPEERQRQSVPVGEVERHLEWALEPVRELVIKKANAVIIDKALQQFTMSYTALSKFLRCRLAFYYEMILKVPFQKNDALAFGSAVHYALERLFITMKQNSGTFPTKEELLGYFKNSLYSESSCFTDVQFERRLEQGNTLLSEYYDYNTDKFATNVEIELKIPRYMLDGVPVTAKIDKLEFDGDTCTVVDYKTGDPDKSASANTAPPNDKEENGGDYWRQMVFYKLLIENYEEKNWKVSLGKFDYIQKSKTGAYKQIIVPVFLQDEEVVRKQLKDSYEAIMAHEFDTGCGKEDCHWCNFAKTYKLVRPVSEHVAEVEI